MMWDYVITFSRLQGALKTSLQEPVDPVSLKEHVQALIGETTLRPFADGASR